MRVIFLSGTYLQAPEGKPEVRLGPGSYMLQPGGNYRHTTSCGKDAACVFFVESDGPFDLKIVQDKPLIVVEFDDEAPALKFEKYLKTGSGREFARRHFRQTTLDTHRRTR